MSDYTLIPTNTIASANFDVFKVDGIEDPLINLDKLSDVDLEESFFAQSVRFMCEFNTEHMKFKERLYRSILEADTQQALFEGYSDYFVQVRTIINKFLKFMQKMLDRYISIITNLIRSDTNLLMHKNDFDKFNGTFEITGYNYTFSENIPNPNAAYNYLNSMFDKLYADSANQLTITSIEDATRDVSLDEDFAKFRGAVLGRSGEIIRASEWSDVLFVTYRDGKKDTEQIVITKEDIKKIRDRYFDINKQKQSLNASYKSIKAAYEKISKELAHMTDRNGDLNVNAFLNILPEEKNIRSIPNKELVGLTMSGEFMSKLDNYIKAKITQIESYTNMHTFAYAAKLDALKERFIQDRNTLYTALFEITVNGGLEK